MYQWKPTKLAQTTPNHENNNEYLCFCIKYQTSVTFDRSHLKLSIKGINLLWWYNWIRSYDMTKVKNMVNFVLVFVGLVTYYNYEVHHNIQLLTGILLKSKAMQFRMFLLNYPCFFHWSQIKFLLHSMSIRLQDMDI